MTNALTQPGQRAIDAIEAVIATGDLSKISATERVALYKQTCESLGLNPLTRPFEYLSLNNKLTLYCRKDATDQLRRLYQVSLHITARDRLDDVYVVTARATTPDGRTDESTGVIALGKLQGEALANALMKAETKAKRRVTLSICGLGWLDETEVPTVPGAQSVVVDANGTIVDATPARPAPAATPEPSKRDRLIGRIQTLMQEECDLRNGTPSIDSGRDLSRLSEAQLIDLGTTIRDRVDSFKAILNVDEPTPPAPATTPEPSPPANISPLFNPAEPAMPRQLAMLQKIMAERGIDWSAEMPEMDMTDLTVDAAGDLIVEWGKRPRVAEVAP